jgi:hypothetical protein
LALDTAMMTRCYPDVSKILDDVATQLIAPGSMLRKPNDG